MLFPRSAVTNNNLRQDDMNLYQEIATGMLTLLPLWFWLGGGWALKDMNDYQMIAMVSLVSAPLMFWLGRDLALEETPEQAMTAAQSELQSADMVLASATCARERCFRNYQELKELHHSKLS